MSDKERILDRYAETIHLVLVRVYDRKERLAAVLPNLPGQGEALRVFHGVLDRDSRIGPEAAGNALQALEPLGLAGQQPVAGLLERARGGEALRVQAVASPEPELLAKIAARDATGPEAEAFVELLTAGDVRAAEQVAGTWEPQPYVIDGILNYFRTHPNHRLEKAYWDKVPLRTTGMSDEAFEAGGVRYAPGCVVRTGCYLGPGTVVMNQAFVNIGAYVAGDGVMVDAGARIATCAQIGKGVKFGAGSGIEGILEPAGRLPSIVEDGAKIGAMCEVSGIVGEGAVLASGVVMASGKKIVDEATGEVIPPREVRVGETRYLLPVIPPYRLAVGGSVLSGSGRVATDAIVLKPGDLRERDTMRHFQQQGILYS